MYFKHLPRVVQISDIITIMVSIHMTHTLHHTTIVNVRTYVTFTLMKYRNYYIYKAVNVYNAM